MRVNVEAVMQLTGAFLPAMLEQGAGAVLNVASIAAYQPLPGFAAYAASKAFVQSFSEAVHEELERDRRERHLPLAGLHPHRVRGGGGSRDGSAARLRLEESDDVARQAASRRCSREAPGVPGRANGGLDGRAPRAPLGPAAARAGRSRRPS